MNNSFSLQQIQKTSNLDANLISRQYKLHLMADFMKIKYENPRLKQSEIANQLGYSSSTLQRYRNDVNMISPYRINPNNTNKRTKKVKNTNYDENTSPNNYDKRRQMTSNDLKRPQLTSKTKSKNVLKGGFVQDDVEINEHYLDKILDNDKI